MAAKEYDENAEKTIESNDIFSKFLKFIVNPISPSTKMLTDQRVRHIDGLEVVPLHGDHFRMFAPIVHPRKQ